MAKKATPPKKPDELLLPFRWCILSCVIPIEVKEFVHREAEEQGRSVSQVVQKALFDHYRPDINRLMFGDQESNHQPQP